MRMQRIARAVKTSSCDGGASTGARRSVGCASSGRGGRSGARPQTHGGRDVVLVDEPEEEGEQRPEAGRELQVRLHRRVFKRLAVDCVCACVCVCIGVCGFMGSNGAQAGGDLQLMSCLCLRAMAVLFRVSHVPSVRASTCGRASAGARWPPAARPWSSC